MNPISLQADDWPLRQSIKQQLADGDHRRLRTLKNIQTAVGQEIRRMEQQKPLLLLGMPAYGMAEDGAWAGFYITPSETTEFDLIRIKFTGSLLTRSFNHLWCEALAQSELGRLTHFAMLHSDVVPGPYWVDALYAEMEAHAADVVAAVIPIKDARGITSTAIDNPADPWEPYRRLTMGEVMSLPETFGIEDIPADWNPVGGQLLLNTGCMLIDMRRPWTHALDDGDAARVYFTIRDRVARDPCTDQWSCYTIPKGWGFSRMVKAVEPAAKLLATRKVRVEHRGVASFVNDLAWGAWHYDEESLDPPAGAAEQHVEDLQRSDNR